MVMAMKHRLALLCTLMLRHAATTFMLLLLLILLIFAFFLRFSQLLRYIHMRASVEYDNMFTSLCCYA